MVLFNDDLKIGKTFSKAPDHSHLFPKGGSAGVVLGLAILPVRRHAY